MHGQRTEGEMDEICSNDCFVRRHVGYVHVARSVQTRLHTHKQMGT